MKASAFFLFFASALASVHAFKPLDVASSPVLSVRGGATQVNCIVRMISGCKDTQTSADVSNVIGAFNLLESNGKAGGACTSALLNILYAKNKANNTNFSFKQILKQLRNQLRSKGFSQIPQLTSSRDLDVNGSFDMLRSTSSSFKGTKRAVMVGCNYAGTGYPLSGCHNDVLNMKDYLVNVQGFKEENIVVLLDDGKHQNPTKANIMKAWANVAARSQPGDVVYIHFSGHGTSIADRSGDEADGKDEALMPAGNVRYASDLISDDEIMSTLIKPMKSGS